MRNPDRIPVILEQVRELWEQHPDWRFGQLVMNVMRHGIDHNPTFSESFTREDDPFQQQLSNFILYLNEMEP